MVVIEQVLLLFIRHLSISVFLLLQDVKAALRRACSLANDLAGRVNDAKGRIDSARAQLQHQQKQQQGRCEDKRGEGEKQEEESVKRVLLAQLKRQKREYRVLFEKLAEAKVDLQHLQQDKRKVITFARRCAGDTQ